MINWLKRLLCKEKLEQDCVIQCYYEFLASRMPPRSLTQLKFTTKHDRGIPTMTDDNKELIAEAHEYTKAGAFNEVSYDVLSKLLLLLNKMKHALQNTESTRVIPNTVMVAQHCKCGHTRSSSMFPVKCCRCNGITELEFPFKTASNGSGE